MITLDALEIDAVREFVNIASGNAASALAQLLGQRTMIEVPRFRCAQIDDIAEALCSGGESTVVVATQLLGDVSGSLLFVMPFSRAHALSAVLRGTPVDDDCDFDYASESCLSETGSILASAYAGALGVMLNGVVMLSVRSFRITLAQNVLERFRSRAGASPFAVCLETTFNVGIQDLAYGAHMVMLPTSQTLESIAKALRDRAWRRGDN